MNSYSEERQPIDRRTPASSILRGLRSRFGRLVISLVRDAMESSIVLVVGTGVDDESAFGSSVGSFIASTLSSEMTLERGESPPRESTVDVGEKKKKKRKQ